MQSNLQVVGCHPLQVQPPSAFINHCMGKVLINAGENLQRLSTEHRLRVAKVEDVIITRLSPECIGGLPGLLLTLEGLDSPNIQLVNRKMERYAAERGWVTLDASKSYRSCFAGVNWLPMPAKALPTGIKEGYFRPLLVRKMSQTSNPLVETGTESENPIIGCEDPEKCWTDSQARLHTLRRIRIWGPRGLRETLQDFIKLCGRLLNINVELFIYDETSPVITYRPGSWSPIDLHFKFLCVAPNDQSRPGFAVRKKRRLDNPSGVSGDSSYWSGPYAPLFFGIGDTQVGRFLPQKAKELRIPPGPVFARLKNGESVTLSDGREIDPSQVCERTEPGIRYCLVNIHDVAGVKEVADCLEKLSVPLWEELEGTGAPFVFNLSPHELIGRDDFESLIESITGVPFGTQLVRLDTQSPLKDRIGNPCYSAEALNRLLHECLPALHPCVPMEASSSFLKRMPLVPKSKWKTDVEGCNIVQSVEGRLGTLKERISRELLEGAARVTSNMRAEGLTAGDRFPMPYVQLLGTGAAIPSKYRNVSSTLLRLSSTTAMLFDCGEGTVTQLFSACDSLEGFYDLIESIQLVCLSHKHADHIMGLMAFSDLRAKIAPRARALKIVAPDEVLRWLRPFLIPECSELVASEDLEVKPRSLVEYEEGVLTCQAAPVVHILRGHRDRLGECSSFGYRIKYSKEGKEVSVGFSGDLSPCPSFTELVEGVDCLIHEATFEDSLEEEAAARYHCTLKQALETGVNSRCKVLVLTHFSQRYPSAPIVCGELGVLSCFGMDLMCVPLAPLMFQKDSTKALKEGLDASRNVLNGLREWLAASSEEQEEQN